MTMHARIAAISISLLAACSSGPSPIADSSVPTDGAIDVVTLDASDASRDSATSDAARDSGFDSSMSDASDAAIADAGMDAADAAPPCECSSGPCCDGCDFRPVTHVCATSRTTGSCLGSSSFCGSQARTLTYADLATHCTGSTTACNGSVVDTTVYTDCYEPTPGNFEQYGVCLPPSGELLARCAVNCGL